MDVPVAFGWAGIDWQTGDETASFAQGLHSHGLMWINEGKARDIRNMIPYIAFAWRYLPPMIIQVEQSSGTNIICI